MKVTNGVVIDENGNTATVAYWGSEEAAMASLATLTDCTNCSNCSYCSYCSRCTRCSNCSDCTSCTDCTDCSDCKKGYVHGVLGGYGFWIDPKTGRARVGCQERDDWETLSQDDVAAMAHDGAEWYRRYWGAWMSIMGEVIGEVV